MRWIKPSLACAALLTASACGVVYTVPEVTGGPAKNSEYTIYPTEFDVRVVPLTYETAAAANLEPYVPPRAPRAFQPGAREAIRRTSLSGPQLPPLPPEASWRARQPSRLEPERLPPLTPPERYRIGIGDVIALSVQSEATSISGLSALISAQSRREGYTVRDDGAVSLPEAGEVTIAGMNLDEAERAIFRALATAGIEPNFTLDIVEFNSQNVSVGGAVGSPTVVPITLQPVNLQRALGAAGGLSVEDPTVSQIEIYRKGQRYRISVDRYFRNPELRQIALEDGDSVFVGSEFLRDLQISQFRAPLEEQYEARVDAQLEREKADWRERLELGMIEKPYAFIAGEAGTQQIELPYERAPSLANVLFENVSLNPAFADYSRIYVLRRDRDPQKSTGIAAYHLDAANAANLLVATDFKIQTNDIVWIATHPITSWNRVLGQLTPQLYISFAQQFALQ